MACETSQLDRRLNLSNSEKKRRKYSAGPPPAMMMVLSRAEGELL
jgi:hypothetical protein